MSYWVAKIMVRTPRPLARADVETSAAVVIRMWRGVLPELDARAVPHTIRHASIFGALDSVKDGRGMVLVAPHDPLPLLAQLEQRSPGLFSVDYLERGPENWRVRFVRA